MTSNELRQKFLNFFAQKGHKIIPSAPLIPENDPSVLFTTAGMHPLVPYLLGQPHPEGKRLVNSQKCLRTDDIDEVGDLCHHTFFEMLGNWSLGDPASPDGIGQGGYWKKDAITWTFEFLTQELKIDPDKLYVTCFSGDEDAPKDTESAETWEELGIPKERIFFNGKKDNWWSSPGDTGPCGPDSEIFIDLTGKPCEKNCQPGCDCGRFTELGNNVFMEYNKTKDGKFEKLKQRNVDFGGGLERILAIVNGVDDDYQTDLFLPIIKKIEEISGKKYEENKKEFRIIADHLKAACFMATEGIITSSQDQRGAILRKLLDRTSEAGRKIGLNTDFFVVIGLQVIEIYKEIYFEVNENKTKIEEMLSLVEQRIRQLLEKPPTQARNLSYEVRAANEDLMIDLEQNLAKSGLNIPPIDFLNQHNFGSLASVYAGTVAFDAKTTSGYPVSEVEKIAQSSISEFKPNEFHETFKILNEVHQNKSRLSGKRLFKGGLGEQSEIATKYHTATHLLHAALRQILGTHVQQKGSNITAERLRFDFSHTEKMTDEQMKKVENLVNEKIKENLEITSEVMDKEKALQGGALGFFTEKYGDKVTVYTIGNPSTPLGRSGSLFSREICGGPHTTSTGELGTFKITKEEAVSAGIRRIRATLT